VERTSRFTLCGRTQGKCKDEVASVINVLFDTITDRKEILTRDKSSEFSAHTKINKCHSIDVFFAKPYASWQRGTNENTNRRLRRIWPKKFDMATLSQKESLSNRRDKLIKLLERTSACWISFLSLQRQEKILLEAKDYSQKTFDIYLNQFSVSRRSLLDVLSAKREYYQSARQLITARVNLLISAYRILILTGGNSGMK
jgi:hypothetical protein